MVTKVKKRHSGLIIIDKLKAQIDKNSLILNNLLTVLTGPPVLEPGNSAPSALQAVLGALLAGKGTADLSNITNDDVKH